VVLAGWGVSRVWIDTSFLANFEDDSSIVLTDTLVNDNFPGTSSLNIVLSSADADRFKDPEVLSLIDSMQAELETHPEVGASFAITDYLKRMHRVMHEDDPNFYAIPENQDLVAQYLLLYEMSGDPDNLTRVVDYNYRDANVTVQLKSDSSAVMDEIIERATRYEEDFASLGVTMNFAGSGYKTLVFAQLLLSGQMWSLLIAFGIVAVLLSLVFHDLWIGLIGTIPIAITAVVNFGAMGLLGIPLSSSTAIISSIAIGIGVDYAIHLIERFREYQKEDLPLVVVAERTLAHSGRAILFNALAVMGGFAVLLWSLFPPNRQVGGLVALNMASSAIGTLTVLLAILIWYSRRVATNNDTHKTVGGNQ
jgi:predicted RND superfamily exporter protein